MSRVHKCRKPREVLPNIQWAHHCISDSRRLGAGMSAARRLPVTYRALPSDEAVEPHLALLKSKVLPLTDLEWKSASRASRTIRTLEVDFRRLSDISETTLSGVSAHANLLERPHLHLLFVFCDARL